MTYNGSLFIDKKLGTGRFGKYEADLKHCTCPDFVKDGLPCMHMYLIAFYSKSIKINRFLHFTLQPTLTLDYNTSKLILNVLWCPSGPESFLYHNGIITEMVL